ncbi:hypothetical protein INT45_003730, partial [Circinella minor]
MKLLQLKNIAVETVSKAESSILYAAKPPIENLPASLSHGFHMIVIRYQEKVKNRHKKHYC